ncbi:MAG: hypothetical protein GY711_10140 [bacterium]|nr:hypothetical protein [bacterium]
MRAISTSLGLLGLGLISLTASAPATRAAQPLTSLSPAVTSVASMMLCSHDQCASATSCAEATNKACLISFDGNDATCRTVLCPDPPQDTDPVEVPGEGNGDG